MRFLVLAAILSVSTSVVRADIPQPASQKAVVWPPVAKATGWVNDFANVISDEYEQKLTSLLSEVEAKTSSEITVVTIESIAPYDEAGYARLLFDSWKPGKKGKDNGVLVLLALKERAWRIETGYGLEAILPDGLCGEIGRNYMVPYFKQGEYGRGLYYAVAALARVIVGNAGGTLENVEGINLKKSANPPAFLYFFAFLFFLVWNLPWPVFIGLPFTLLFAFSFYQMSPLAGFLVIAGYIASMIFRYKHWTGLSPKRRRSFFGTQYYVTRTHTGGFGGFGGGFGGSGGFGGFGGGGGGGGGAGGRF